MLVPEITLTMQIVDRFYEWFGEKVAIFHSALSNGEKYDEYLKIVETKIINDKLISLYLTKSISLFLFYLIS